MANGHMSAMSIRSSAATPMPRDSRISNASSMNHSGSDNDEDSTGEFGDGNATLTAQNRALQADLADRNRYIATLEKRLLQARRSSQSRTSFGISGSPHKMFPGPEVIAEGRVEVLLKEKDDEIAELRARLDDKERMVAALRSAARKRDMADVSTQRRSGSSEDDGGGARAIKTSGSDSTLGDLQGTF